MNENMRYFLLTILLLIAHAGFTQCADAGRDTLICGYRYGMIGSPPGGTWSYLCSDSTRWVEMGSTGPSGLAVAIVEECGTYSFVYSINEPGCTDSDTLQVNYEDPSTQTRAVSYDIDILYGGHNCQGVPYDSCGNIRVLPGADAPNPRWTITLNGVCDVTYPMPLISQEDSSSCTAVVNHLGMNKLDTFSTFWSSSQSPFVEVNRDSGTIINNRFDQFLSILERGLFFSLDTACYPFEKCFIDKGICADTLYDTIPVIMPVHLGGYWGVVDSSGVQILQDTTDITVGGKMYRLIIATGARNFGPGDLQFELYRLEQNELADLDTSIILNFFWTEDWTYDTIQRLIPRIIASGTCTPCGSRAITYDTLIFPEIPMTFCPTMDLVFNPPIVGEINGDTVLCEDGFVILAGPDGFDMYDWSNGTTSKFNYIIDTGTYSLIATDSNGCTLMDEVEVIRVDIADYEFIFDSTEFCENSCASFDLVGTGIHSYVWSNGTEDTATIYCFTDQDLTIVVDITDTSGCFFRDTLILDIEPTEIISAGVDQVLTCIDTEVTLQPDTVKLQASTYFKWLGPGIDMSNMFVVSPTVDQPGTYILLNGEDSTRCLGRDTVIVRLFDDAPNVEAGEPLLINCENDEVTLMGSIGNTGPSTSFYWEGPGIDAGNRDRLDPTVDAPGEYIIFGCNDITGCCNSDTVAVGFNKSQPRADAGRDRVITCDTTQVTLGGSGTSTGFDVTYMWTGPDIDASNENDKNPRIKLPGMYIFRVVDTVSKCFSEDAVLVTMIGDVPVADAGDDQLIDCDNSTVTLSSAGSSMGPTIGFQWIGPGINAQNRFNPSPVVMTPGIYVLEVLDSLGNCEARDTVEVIRDQEEPEISAGSDLTIDCNIRSLRLQGEILNPNGRREITWNGPGIDPTNENLIMPSVNEGGTYILLVRDTVNNCIAMDTVVVTEDFNPPSVTASDDVDINCEVQSVAIRAEVMEFDTVWNQFYWEGPGISFPTREDLQQVVSEPGIYIVNIVAVNSNCNDSDTVIVGIDTIAPDIDAGAGGMLGCSGDSVVLTGTSASPLKEVEWTTSNGNIIGSNTNLSITVNSTGEYYLRVVGENGCVAYDTTSVTEWQAFELVITQTSLACDGQDIGEVRFGIRNGSSPFMFSVDGAPFSTELLYSGLSAGSHVVVVMDGNGCLKSFDFEVEGVEAFDVPMDTLEFRLCDSPNLIIGEDFGYPDAEFMWLDDPSALIKRSIKAGGLYQLQFSNICDTAIVNYLVISDLISPDLEIVEMANAFTPNGDNMNDEFGPVFNVDIDNLDVRGYRFSVFDRWGKMMFESTDPSQKWDGTFEGENAPSEVYLFVIVGEVRDCKDNSEVIRMPASGDVTLVR